VLRIFRTDSDGSSVFAGLEIDIQGKENDSCALIRTEVGGRGKWKRIANHHYRVHRSGSIGLVNGKKLWCVTTIN